MTLVASFDIDKHPILIGDLMISRPSKGESYKPFKIPTYDDVNRDVPDYLGYVVSGLKQKVILLNRNLAIAWVGDVIAAITVVKEINKTFSNADITISELINYLGNIDYLGNLQLYITGLVLQKHDEKIACCRFAWDSHLGWESNKFLTQELGKVYAGGTGSYDFENIVTGMHVHPSTQATSAKKAITTSLSIISQLTGHQMRTGAGLPVLYGGGYELVTLLDGELRKIDDVIYHFWIVKRLANGEMNITFQKTLKIAYYQDFLVICKVDMYIDQENDNRSTMKNELYVIPPIHRAVSEEEKDDIKQSIKAPPLNAMFSMFYIHVPQAGEENNILSFAHYAGNKPPPVKYSFENEGVMIEINEDLIKRLDSGINRLMT